MTPQEKAKELVERYNELLFVNVNQWGTSDAAKQCALIAVDEILNLSLGVDISHEADDYWQQVKKAIQSL